MSFLSKSVYDYRRAMLDKMMDKEGLDGVVIFASDFFQFFTNFHVDVLTWERPIALIIPKKKPPIALLNALSTHHIGFAKDRDSLWLEMVTFYCEFPLSKGEKRSSKSFGQQLTDLLDGHGLAAGKIGFDTGISHLNEAKKVHNQLEFSPILRQLRDMRLVKHAEELAIMADLCLFTDWIQDQYRSSIRPGRLIHELDYSIAARVFEQAAQKYPGENFEYRFFTLSGPSSASPHGDTGQAGALINKNDGLINILIPRLNGVAIENERTYFCGSPTDLQKRAFEAALEANLASISQIRTGNLVSAIDHASREIFHKAGFSENIMHRTGHGMGLINHEFPADMPYNYRPLMANEVYSAEPGIYLPGVGGFRFDDTVVVSNDGPIVLTSAPKDMESQTIHDM